MTRKIITHQTWTICIILRHPFYFTTLPNYDSRLKPSGSSRWSQRFSQALGFARLDSVSLLFASYIDDFSSLQYRYVRGWNMRYKCFHLFMDSQPDFYFICPTNPPASLCASRPTLAARICLHLSRRLACIMERSVVVIWFLWGQKLIVAFRRGTFLFVLIIILKVLWLTSNRCWADVGGRHQPNVETTLGRHRTADIDPTSDQHMFPCSFFSLHNLPELLCAEIVPMLEAAINSGLVFGMVTDLLYTNMKTWFILTHWGPDKMIAIFQTTFSNAFSWMQIYEFRLNFTEVCLQGSNWQYIPTLVQINGLAPASNKPLSFCTLCLDQSVHLRNRTVTSLDMWILHWRR